MFGIWVKDTIDLLILDYIVKYAKILVEEHNVLCLIPIQFQSTQWPDIL